MTMADPPDAAAPAAAPSVPPPPRLADLSYPHQSFEPSAGRALGRFWGGIGSGPARGASGKGCPWATDPWSDPLPSVPVASFSPDAFLLDL